PSVEQAPARTRALDRPGQRTDGLADDLGLGTTRFSRDPRDGSLELIGEVHRCLGHGGMVPPMVPPRDGHEKCTGLAWATPRRPSLRGTDRESWRLHIGSWRLNSKS